MIEFDEKIVALWYLDTVPGKQDWLAAIREIEPDQKYELIYRFRYYVDDKAMDSEDKKNWYRGTLTGSRNFAIMGLRSTAKTMAAHSRGKLYELVNDKGIEQLMREFQDLPFVYVRQEGQKP